MDPDPPGKETNGNCSVFESDIFSVVAATSSVSHLLSLLANLFVLFLIVLFKRWGFFHQRLILYLTLANAANSLAGAFTRVDHQDEGGVAYSRFCSFAGFMLQVTSWMVLDVYVSILSALLLKAFFSVNLEKMKSDILILVFILVFPFSFNWIPFINKAYGDTGAWCWIASIKEDTCESFLFGRILQIVLWYLPLYTILCVLIVIYSMVVTKFCLYKRNWMDSNSKAAGHRQQAIRYSVSLLAYPVVYFITNIMPLINRIHGLAYPNQPSVPLWFLSGIIYPLQGVGVAIAFLLDSDIRKRLNPTGVKAAFTEWYRKERVYEYPLKDVKEDSIEYHKL